MKKCFTTSSIRAIALLSCALVALAFVLPINAARAQDIQVTGWSQPFDALPGFEVVAQFVMLPPAFSMTKKQAQDTCRRSVKMELYALNDLDRPIAESTAPAMVPGEVLRLAFGLSADDELYHSQAPE